MTERGKAPGFRRKYFPPLACGPRLFVYFERPVQIVPASGPNRVSLSPRPFKIPRATLPTAIQDFDSRRSTPLSANQYDLARVHAHILPFVGECVRQRRLYRAACTIIVRPLASLFLLQCVLT